MSRLASRAASRRHRRGVLTFEWILLISVVVIGIIGGLSAVRDALICELKDLADCITSLNVCQTDCVDCQQPIVCDPSIPDPNCNVSGT
jgi:hypothetical protein